MADQKVVVVPVGAQPMNPGDGSVIAVQETVKPFPPAAAATQIKTGVKVDSPTDKLV
jgi:hypothetical protein